MNKLSGLFLTLMILNYTNFNIFFRLIRFLEPTEGFQDSYIYSNLMYGLLARSTEMLTGASWESSMREHLLLPLGMQDVCFSNDITECKYDRATGHIYYGSMHQPISPNYHRYGTIVCEF